MPKTQDNPPTALDLPPVDPLPPQTQRYFDICQEKLGLVPNVLRAHAFDIDKLNAFSALYTATMLAESGLSKLEREFVAVVVSAQNRCHYCQIAHGAALRELSGDPAWADTVLANVHAADLSARQRALAQFALAVTHRSSTVGEADRQALRDAGFSDRDIWDIAMTAAFFNMTNRLASATGMVPNAAYYAAAR